MNPLAIIEKWISEHGSAASLRDHLALVKEQMTALEKENTALKEKVKNLEIDNQDLRAKVAESETPDHPIAYAIPLHRPPSSM